jgi:hypothetical protein
MPRSFPLKSRPIQAMVLAVVLINIILFVSYWGPLGSLSIPSLSQSQHVNELSQVDPDGNPKKRAAIVNALGTHDEVVVTALYTLYQMPEYDVELFFSVPRYGIQSIIDQFYHKPVLSPYSFGAHYGTTPPDMVILTSCDTMDFYTFSGTIMSMVDRNPDLKFLCVTHNPHVVQEFQQAMLPFVQKGVMTMVGLSPHVADYMKNVRIPELGEYDPAYLNVPTFTFVPTFEYQATDKCATNGTQEENKDCLSRFVVQGLFEPGRRDYNSLFESLKIKLEQNETAWKDFQLQLLGQGSPFQLEPPLSDHISTFNNIPYLEYYDKIHHSMALLPAFASDSYYEYKASSSVGASLLTGVPMIADQKLLNSYTHLTRDGVYFQEDGENVIDTVERLRSMPISEVIEKRANASAMNQNIIQDNINRFRSLYQHISM